MFWFILNIRKFHIDNAVIILQRFHFLIRIKPLPKLHIHSDNTTLTSL